MNQADAEALADEVLEFARVRGEEMRIAFVAAYTKENGEPPLTAQTPNIDHLLRERLIDSLMKER